MCDPQLVYAILEVLTLLQRATENEYIDEVCYFFGFEIRIKLNSITSMNLPGSITPNEPTLLYSSQTTIKFAMKFLPTYLEMPNLGLNWP